MLFLFLMVDYDFHTFLQSDAEKKFKLSVLNQCPILQFFDVFISAPACAVR